MFRKILMVLFLFGAVQSFNCLAMNAAEMNQVAADKSAQEPKLSAEETKLMQRYGNAQTQLEIDQVTQKLSRNSRSAGRLALWLKLKGTPNLSEVFISSPLRIAIRFVNIPGIKVLLADPRTIISDELENSNNLITAMANGAGQVDPSDDKKIIKMLLYFGFNPTFKEERLPTAQETAHTYDFFDADYSKFMDNYKNIEACCTQEELVEFREVMLTRMRNNHAYLVKREVHGPHAKVVKKRVASAVPMKLNGK